MTTTDDEMRDFARSLFADPDADETPTTAEEPSTPANHTDMRAFVRDLFEGNH